MALKGRKKPAQRKEPVLSGRGSSANATRPTKTAKPRKASKRGKTKKPRRRRSRLYNFITWGLTLCLWLGVAAAVASAYVFFTLDQKGMFTIPEREPGIMLLASDGSVLAERGAFFGDAVRIDQVPAYLPNAVIAIEDRRFRSHFGIDPIGLARAAVNNYRAGRVVQGGSTLTQQLAKNLFLTNERTYKRKFYELVLAIWLENKFTKDEILQLYLNRVYFGAGAIGVEKASQKFFNKSARDISLSEATILAAMLKAPTTYNPIRHPKRATKRARLVLRSMVKTGAITEQEATQATKVKAKIKSTSHISAKQYIVDWVSEQLPQLIGKLDESVVVQTTIDMKLQKTAENAIAFHLAKEGKAKKAGQGAAVVLDTTGAVKAMIGGKSYLGSQYNRATKAKRQPGSAFKPFVYLTAIEHGMTPDTVEVDEPIKVGDWTPGNYNKKFRGPITLTTALSKSINTVAVKLALKLGPQSIANTARRLGISSDLKTNASIALGTSEVTLLELTNAFAPFANGGFAVLPHVVTKISTQDGKVLYQRQGSGLGKAIYDYDLGDINTMMQAVVDKGTGKKARISGRAIAGKTGTTQDYRDAWFIGYSAQLITGVWIGNDDNSPTHRVTGGSLPAEVFHDIMTPALAKLPALPLPGEQRPGYVQPPEFNGNEPVYGEVPPTQPTPTQPAPKQKEPSGIGDFLSNIFGIDNNSKPAKKSKTQKQRDKEWLKERDSRR